MHAGEETVLKPDFSVLSGHYVGWGIAREIYFELTFN